MKLITLNIWGGRVSETLPEFFAKHQDVDLFCFQEVFCAPKSVTPGHPIIKVKGYETDPDLFANLERLLPGHQGYFCEVFKETYGIAVFVRKNINVLAKGDIIVAQGNWTEGMDWKDENDHDRKIQWLKLKVDGEEFTLINAHLTHRPEGKLDSPKRIQQSKTISDFLKTIQGSKILAGDFNLMPDTESIAVVEAAGMRNLIKEYKVERTRTRLYRGFVGGPKFADYIFTSPDIQVNDFKVLPDIVSDHSPVEMEFDL